MSLFTGGAKVAFVRPRGNHVDPMYLVHLVVTHVLEYWEYSTWHGGLLWKTQRYAGALDAIPTAT